MLNEAVAEKQGKRKQTFDAELDVQVEAYLPADYVADGPRKIDLYQRIRKAKTSAEFEEIEDDLLDRFGELPEAAQRLLLVGRLKAAADRVGIATIRRDFKRQNILVVTFDARSKFTAQQFTQALALAKVRGQVVVPDPVKAEVPIQPNQTAEEWLTGLLTVFNTLAPEEGVANA